MDSWYDEEKTRVIRDHPEMEPWVERNPRLREIFLKQYRESFTEKNIWEIDGPDLEPEPEPSVFDDKELQ